MPIESKGLNYTTKSSGSIVVEGIISHVDNMSLPGGSDITRHLAYTVVSPTDPGTTTQSTPGEMSTSHVLAYVLVPLGSLVVIAVLSFLVVFILKKSRLDRLRHHLMPLYNFDPAEEEGDWESELLEEDKEQQAALSLKSPSLEGPKLKFNTDHLEL